MDTIDPPHGAPCSVLGLDPGSVTVSQLRAFVATVEAGSFTAAARKLGTSQSAVSHALRALEVALGGTPLLSRSEVAPTALGAAALVDAKQALAAVARLRQRGTAAAGLATGHLRLAAVGERLGPPLASAIEVLPSRLPADRHHVLRRDRRGSCRMGSGRRRRPRHHNRNPGPSARRGALRPRRHAGCGTARASSRLTPGRARR